MAFQAVPNTASFRVVSRQINTGVEMLNTIYVRNTQVGWDQNHLGLVGVVIGNAWRDNVMPQLQTTVVLDRVDCRDEGAEFGEQRTEEYNTAGSVAGTPLSLSACMYVKIKGGGGSAPRRGALYLSGFGEADLTIDTWDATRSGAVQTAIQAVDAAIDGIGGFDAQVIVSRFSKTAVPLAPHKRSQATTNTIASFEVSQRLAMQRDRRVGEGS